MVRGIAVAVALGLVGCGLPGDVPVFLWHGVGTNAADAYDVPPDEFDQELQALEAWGATPVTLAQVMDASEGHGALPARPVVLTFDDGREEQLTQALPILLRHHMVAETFLISGFLGEDEATRRVDHPPTGDVRYLTWPEVRELEASGAFVGESHSVDHARFTHLSDAAQKAELRDSKVALEARLGHEVAFFAYPFGAYQRGSRSMAKDAGYRAAFTVHRGLGSRFASERVSLHRGDLRKLEETLRQTFGEPLPADPDRSR